MKESEWCVFAHVCHPSLKKRQPSQKEIENSLQLVITDVVSEAELAQDMNLLRKELRRESGKTSGQHRASKHKMLLWSVSVHTDALKSLTFTK